MPQTIYDFEVKNLYGERVSLSEYRGKVLLIVNTASQCGLTPQMAGMTELYNSYKDRGFEILAFPSNDFKGQEPLEGKAIEEFCDLRYRAKYPIFEKVHVRGPQASELYRFLANKQANGKVGLSPLWNFQKYLINRQGQVVTYFFPFTKPTANRLKKAIEALL